MTEVGTGEALNLDDQVAWMGRYECGCVVAVSIGGEDDWVFTEDPEIVAVEQTTLSAARNALTSAHSRRPCELLAEVERLRAQQDEALRILTRDGPDADFYVENCRQAVRVLSRTEDGIQPRSYYDVVRSMTADPDVLAAVDKAEAEDGTDERCRLIAESAFRDFPALLAEVQRLTAELALKDQALDEIKEQARRWLKIASTAGGPEDVAYNEGLRDCQGDIQRILTRLDTQGETK